MHMHSYVLKWDSMIATMLLLSQLSCAVYSTFPLCVRMSVCLLALARSTGNRLIIAG